MTERKGITRRRRTTAAASNVPWKVADWFEGNAERRPWASMIFPGCVLLPEWWAAWATGHEGACPPAGAEWLTDPQDPRHHQTGPGARAARAMSVRRTP